MSILKGILHHWNKTTQSYDTIHPETEVSQVTDWNQGIVNTLASTALGALVNTLTSDSLLATMIQKVLTATGVKYSMGQNGYVCFGSLVGGLIIQWGIVSIPASNKNREEILVSFPITVNAVMNIQSSCRSPVGITRAGDETRSTITIVRIGAWTAGSITVDWKVICK